MVTDQQVRRLFTVQKQLYYHTQSSNVGSPIVVCRTLGTDRKSQKYFIRVFFY